MPNVMPMKNGETIEIAVRMNGQTIIDVLVTGYKEKKSKEDVQIINVIKILSG